MRAHARGVARRLAAADEGVDDATSDVRNHPYCCCTGRSLMMIKVMSDESEAISLQTCPVEGLVSSLSLCRHALAVPAHRRCAHNRRLLIDAMVTQVVWLRGCGCLCASFSVLKIAVMFNLF